VSTEASSRNWRRRPPWSWCTLRNAVATPPLDHLIALSDDVGVIQHAVEDVPNRATGYCTDDVSRALMVALSKLQIDPADTMAERLATIYLAFLHDAQLDDGRFHNFMSYERTWLDAVGTHDSVGRAMWSLGYAMRYAQRDSWRRVSKCLFDRGLAAMDWLHYPRSQAYAAIGLAQASESEIAEGDAAEYRALLAGLANALEDLYERTRDAEWHWFENAMTYDNARLCEALLRAGQVLKSPGLLASGLRTLEFYCSVTIENGIFVPIGNEGWYPRGGTRARYSQQPLEAVSLLDAALVAADATGDPVYRSHAQRGLDWYLGRNTRGIPMARGGGCLDGLNETSVNMNMGAESTLAYLSSAYALAARPAKGLTIARSR
jgi:hypothetical protein